MNTNQIRKKCRFSISKLGQGLALVAAGFMLCLIAQAGSIMFFGSTFSLANNTGTNTTTMGLTITNANYVLPNPFGNIAIQHSAMANTNLQGYVQISLDNVNFVTATANWGSINSNATVETWTPVWTMPTIYWRGVLTNQTGAVVSNIAGTWNGSF